MNSDCQFIIAYSTRQNSLDSVLGHHTRIFGEHTMQGYLTPNRLDLTIRQNRNYFQSQCGLCQQLKKDYGSLTRFLVNRDALILQLLTEAQLQQEPLHQKIRCGVQPFLHSAKANSKAAKFAAAVTVIMFWGKLTDTIADANGKIGTRLKRQRRDFKNWALMFKLFMIYLCELRVKIR